MAASAPAAAPESGTTASGAMIWTALAVVYVVWGSTYLAIRVVVEADIPPMLGMATRFLTAALLLATALGLKSGRRRLRITRREALGAATVGILLLAFGNGAVAVAEQTVPSGLAALLVAAIPLWLMLLRVGGGERPRALTWFGVLIGFGGAALLALSGGGNTGAKPWSVGILVIGTISWAIGSRYAPRLGLPRDPLVTSVYEMVFGGTAMLLIGLLSGEPGRLHVGQIDGSGWLALGYLVVFGSLLAYSAYSFLLANAPISLIGTYAYVNPAVAVLLGWLILSEVLSWQILLGGAVIIVGVALVVTAERRTT